MSKSIGWYGVLVSIVMLLGLGCVGCEQQSADRQAVENVWRQYVVARETSNGKAVLTLTTKGTWEFYDRLLKKGLNAAGPEVKKLSDFEKFEIITMRHLGRRSQLSKLDGKGYMEYATSKGWYSGGGDPDGPLYYELGAIKLAKDKNSAWAEVYVNDLIKKKKRKSDYAIKFFKEDGSWKLDETSIHLMLSHEIAFFARYVNMSVDDFLVKVLEIISGTKVSDTIWYPSSLK